MDIMIAVVSLVGAVAALDLLLTLGVVRRLREHTRVLARLQLNTPSGPVLGQRPAQFTAATINGEEISSDLLTGPALVGFFAPGCAPCKERIPQFTAAARALGLGAVPALAVVATDGDGADELAASLRGAAKVVIEDSGGPVHKAFSVRGWPTLIRLDTDGKISSTDNDEVLSAPVGS